MLDIRLIRENPEFVKTRLATRGGDSHLQIEAILEIDAARRRLRTRLQQLQADRNRMSKEIGAKKRAGGDTSEIEATVRGFGEETAELNRQAAAADEKQKSLLLNIPNLPHDGAPVGNDASQNPVVKTWGEKPVVTNPLDHIKLGERLGLFDLERAAKLSGSGFVCFTRIGAKVA